MEYDLHAPHILGMLTPFYEGQYVMQTLSSRNVCISTGTACGHGLLLSDRLVHKIETTQHEADQYVRVSFSKNTTLNEIDQCFDQLENILKEVALDEPS
ncbi:aminotransferase class V-fold PLP-dependent enzyme [Staphylococcus carnosus]|uniref:aminotransferase class V-fold PLP-dependent enzyme n=1 Tax=Staphylococcus carnosus TaxID=1281 RepID=UPI000B19D617|nr:aminotransferase class V-fold PLP-dependent enzyme [Staphylococcus carnosus]GEP80534.1 hypothetical protein SCA05_23270 [Staphylococcus carnosus]SUM06001.1 putative Cysteine desulfurase/aminotransferase,class V [Staphylococcus carnosus]